MSKYFGLDISEYTKHYVKESSHDQELVTHLDDCAADSHFVKLKYAKIETTYHKYSEFYEEGIIGDRILTEFILKMDQQKSTTKRNSTQFLDFLGSIGGFKGALNMFFMVLGGWFSAKF